MYTLVTIDLDVIEVEEQIPDTNVSTIRKKLNELFDDWEDIAAWWVEDKNGNDVPILTKGLP